MGRLATAVLMVAAAAPVAAAHADGLQQVPSPWPSPPFTTFYTQQTSTIASGNVLSLASGPGPLWYLTGFDPVSDTPASFIGGGSGYQQISLPSGATPFTMFQQGSTTFFAGRVGTGAFVQGFNDANGSSAGATAPAQPGGTSLTATSGATLLLDDGSTEVLVFGVDSINHTQETVDFNVAANGTVGQGQLCPNTYTSVTSGGSGFAPAAIAVNSARQKFVAGVSIPGGVPVAGPMSADCTTLSLSAIPQPGGGADQGFVENLEADTGGNFDVGGDLSPSVSPPSIFANKLTSLGGQAPGFAPFAGQPAGDATLKAIAPSLFALIGSERASGFPSLGVVYCPTRSTFADSHGADVVPQFVRSVGNRIAVGGLGSPVSGPNTLDVWIGTPCDSTGTPGGGAGTSTPNTPSITPTSTTPCTPVLTAVKLSGYLEEYGGHLVSVLARLGTVSHVGVGQPVHYEIAISNEGSCDATDVVISDALPREMATSLTLRPFMLPPDGKAGVQVYDRDRKDVPGASVDGTLSAGGGGTVSVHLGRIPANAFVTVHIAGFVKDAARFKNTATVSADELNLIKTNTVTIASGPIPAGGMATADANGARGTTGLPLRKGSVFVAFRLAGPRCRWLINPNATFTSVKPSAGGFCLAPIWLPAKGSTKWRYRLRKRLPRGSYTMLFKVVSPTGVYDHIFSPRHRNLIDFQVR